MKPSFSLFGLPFGISATFWGLIGVFRFITEKLFRKYKTVKRKKNKYRRKDIAVIIPAHNEEVVIRNCIKALKLSLEPKQIHVVSDGSIDKTYRRARLESCHVSYLKPGRGKAKALIYLLKRYKLFENYKLIFIVDADTRVDINLVSKALPYFNDPKTAVVFAGTKINWPQHLMPRLKWYFVAYRERLNKILVYFYIYGQTWKHTNLNYVIPGFCTIYRTDVLRQLQIDTPGLLIEDFNLAFQLHKKKLGNIGYDPSLIGWEEYPDNLRDYWKQVKRWNIGFFQTVKMNGIWPSFFWLTLGVFSLEVIMSSFFLVILPLLLILWFSTDLKSMYPTFAHLSWLYKQFGPYQYLNLQIIFLSIFVFDYATSVFIGLTHKRPQFIIYGLFFFFMHYVTSLILISSLIPGFFSTSEGRWISPKRSGITDS